VTVGRSRRDAGNRSFPIINVPLLPSSARYSTDNEEVQRNRPRQKTNAWDKSRNSVNKLQRLQRKRDEEFSHFGHAVHEVANTETIVPCCDINVSKETKVTPFIIDRNHLSAHKRLTI